MGLRAFVIRRILLMIPTLIGVTLLIFAVMQFFSPTQRASLYIRDAHQQGQLIAIIEQYHLKEPVWVQYVSWIQSISTGNLGWSKSINLPVASAILQRAPATAEITLFASPIIILVGVYLGIKSAVHRDKPLDHATRSLSIIGYSLPSFWLGIILLVVFFGWLRWFPPERLSADASLWVQSSQYGFIHYTGLNTVDGILNGQLWVTVDAIRHLVLPIAVLTIISIAAIVRVMRSSMLEALNKSYIIMAKSKGLASSEVINKHARRNALIPIVTLSGMMIAGMLNGVVITETVFAFNGIGRWAATAAISLDIPAVLGFALFSGMIFIVANLIVDILYAYIDPRIRLG